MTNMSDTKDPIENLKQSEQIEHIEDRIEAPFSDELDKPHKNLYDEALHRYPNDESIDQISERKLKRKLDMRIIPLLGICYFFYVSD